MFFFAMDHLSTLTAIPWMLSIVRRAMSLRINSFLAAQSSPAVDLIRLGDICAMPGNSYQKCSQTPIS